MAIPPSGEQHELVFEDQRASIVEVGGGHHPYIAAPTGRVDNLSLDGEPMTCPPQAFRTGDDLIRLEPGETFPGVWGITVS